MRPCPARPEGITACDPRAKLEVEEGCFQVTHKDDAVRAG